MVGMQVPPAPTPGWWAMNAKGLVAAASITSAATMPIRRHSSANSLMNEMLTRRKEFSSSLDASATSTGSTRCVGTFALA